MPLYFPGGRLYGQPLMETIVEAERSPEHPQAGTYAGAL